MCMILIHFFKNTARVQEQLSKYDYGQNSKSRFVYIHITNISDIKITYIYTIIPYTNYYQCMMFPIFSTASDIAQVTTSQGIKPFSCMICYYSSLVKYKVKLHTKTYHDECEMPLLYRICDKNFRINKSLDISAYPIPNAVSETHTEIKPHYHLLCELTMTHFGIKFHLWTIYITVKHIYLICHMTTHTGEKPWKCPQCYIIILSLIRSPQMPKTIHTGGDSLACTRFVMLNCIIINLTNHLRFHSKERPYQCSYCDRILPNLTNILMPSFF